MKEILAAPGPTPLPPEVLEALQRPMIHHRSPEFTEIMMAVREGLKKVFATQQEVLVISCSGTGAMEAAIANLTSAKDKVLVVEAGKFGERWTQMAKAYGLEVVVDHYEYGEEADPGRIEKILKQEPQIKLLCVQACETSTGVLHPIRELAQLTKKTSSTLLVVDGITAVGVSEVPMDAWGIDVLICGSQKALMIPPGLGFIALSSKAWQMQEQSCQPRFYFDLSKHQKSLLKNDNAFTPAINLLFGLQAALALIEKEGLAQVYARHAKLAKATQDAVRALGLQLFAKKTCAHGLTAVVSPPGVDGSQVVKKMKSLHNITIAGGQGDMKGKIFRLAHMGYVSAVDLMGILSALEHTLSSLGYNKFESGASLVAAQRILAA